ncbi:MAG: response regulator [Deltaproteobacteria bacterium]|nr:response regulator [Deltaproteobacteria bacterium]
MDNKKSKDYESTLRHDCPVTGLPILRRPEWTDVSFGKDYKLTVSILGDCIILNQPSGYATLQDIENALRLLNKVVAEIIGEGRPYVHISDYSNLQGASLEARKCFIDGMKKKDRLLGIIFFGTSPMFKLSIKLAKRLNIVKFNVEIVNDYSEAVELALKMLPAGKTQIGEALVHDIPQPSVVLPGEELPHKIRTSHERSLKSDGFSAQFEIIDGYIFHWVSTGFFEEEHIVPIFEINDEAFTSMDRPEGPFYFILGVAEISGSTRKARKLYIDRIKEWQQHHPFEMLAIYGANRFLSAAINLASPFAPFNVRMTRDFDSALKLIAKEKSNTMKSSFPLADITETISPVKFDQIQQYADELLQYLGSIDWETDGLGNVKEVDPSHPFSPVFDAINLVKAELDELFQERRRSEEERVKLEAKLQRAQKMEAIGALAGGVAHDLNNILSGLVGYPDLLLMDMPSDSPLRKPILTIQKSGEKAAAIVQDLLTLARRGVAVNEVVNLNHIISEYLQSLEHGKIRLFHSNAEFETRFETNLLNIMGSPVHLSKTIMNLVSNAAEAMPAGGNIFVSTENRYIDRPIRGYDDVKEGDYVTLSVSDTGIGISPEDMERIFEPFYTKKVMGRSGTGLGMAVVWGTVKDHNGYIDVQSTEGKGTTFILYFPVTREDLAKDKFRFSVEDLMGNGESILIVDDVPEQREIVSGMLRKLAYSATSVSGGEEAFDYMRDNPADLLVLDMIMDPGIDGLETYKRILELHPGQKAIIASGFSETDRIKEAKKLGAGQYVKKPYTLEKIGLAVKEELEN